MLAKALQGATAAADKLYIEDVMSTYLYTGNGSTQTITNGIDLSGKGGLVWIKGRSGATAHRFTDTARGATKSLESNSTAAEATESTGVTSFSSTGFALGADADYNTNAATYCSWTFRKAAKFFDVVTWVGNGASSRSIAHNLGSVPGCIIVKNTSAASTDWLVWHRSFPSTNWNAYLNYTFASGEDQHFSSSGATVTSTTFPVKGDSGGNAPNVNGNTYVAYLFAHDAGGFGASGNDSVIKCGTFTPNGSYQATVDLGWEPQWVLIKSSTTASGWYIIDNMRGWANGSNDAQLQANSSSAESSAQYGHPLATGFYADGFDTSIYIAIRRGPMKTPTDATKVFSTFARSGTGAAATITTPAFPVDFILGQERTAIGLNGGIAVDRLRGAAAYLRTPVATAEGSNTTVVSALDSMTGFSLGASDGLNGSSSTYANWVFRRAPGFFDVVGYTGNATNRTVSHSLGVVPELMIIKSRTTIDSWYVYTAPTGPSNALLLDTTQPSSGYSLWNNTSPTASVFSLGIYNQGNRNGDNYIAYLFATCPGVSKVGSYTGTGTTQQINCGFTAGARFVLIKRTDSTGDWYIWDSARGIISANDPYLLLNSAAAEVTNTDYIDPLSSGFQISSTAPAAINANGGSYIYLSVA